MNKDIWLIAAGLLLLAVTMMVDKYFVSLPTWLAVILAAGALALFVTYFIRLFKKNIDKEK